MVSPAINTFAGYPRRGEMNSNGIYVLPDFNSNNIGFYDLTQFEGNTPIIKSQSGPGYWGGSCGFQDENTAVCATRTTGDIYKYDLNNNYQQQKISTANPSGNGFLSLLVTKDQNILAAYLGCIFI